MKDKRVQKTVDRLNDLVAIINTEEGDLPLLVNKVRSQESSTWLRKKLSGETVPTLTIESITDIVKIGAVEGDFENYFVQEGPDPDPRYTQIEVILTPHASVSRVCTTVRVKKGYESA
jgi:hypothetical protein